MQAVEAQLNNHHHVVGAMEVLELDLDDDGTMMMHENDMDLLAEMDMSSDNLHQPQQSDQQQEEEEQRNHPLLSRRMDIVTAWKHAHVGSPSVASDPSMRLSAEERTWSLQLKQALQQYNDDLVYPLTDFEIVHYALVTRGNLKQALNRIHGLQVFRQEYGIDDSIDQALLYFTEWFRHHPGHLLHMDTDAETCEPIVVLDLQTYLPGIATGHRRSNVVPDTSQIKGGHDFAWRVDIIRNFYQLHINCSNFASIRQGVFMIIDCDGLSWENFTMEYTNRYHSELWAHYPLKYKSTLCYNTGSIANVCWNMIKPLMDATGMRESLQLGCQIVPEMEGTPTPERLCELYLQPDLETAQCHLLQRLKELWTLRKINMQRFRL